MLPLDEAVADPADPIRPQPAFDSGDHLHLSPAGYPAMLLLELERGQGGRGLEVAVEARDAHVELRGEILDAQRLVESAAQHLDGPHDAMAFAAEADEVLQAEALLAPEQPVDDLPHGRWRQDPVVRRPLRQANES